MITNLAWIPWELLVPSLIAAVAALLTTTLLTVPFLRIARRLGIMATPGGRHSHTEPTPCLGGVPVSVGIATGTWIAYVIGARAFGAAVPPLELLVLGLSSGLVLATGVVDDARGLSALTKLLAEIAAALIVVSIGWNFTALSLPWGDGLELGMFGPLLTVVWIVGVTNATNLLDGMDGLACGVVAIVASSLFIYSIVQSDLLSALLSAAVAGSCVGFFPHNRTPAQVFLGDSGSLTLGFIIAVISVRTAIKAPAAVAIMIPILVLGVPVIDTLLVMLHRFVRRPARFGVRVMGMFIGDEEHLHHRLGRLAPSRRATVRILYLLVLVFCAMALAVNAIRNGWLAWAVVAFQVLAVVTLRSLGGHQRAWRQRLGSWVGNGIASQRGSLPARLLDDDGAER